MNWQESVLNSPPKLGGVPARPSSSTKGRAGGVVPKQVVARFYLGTTPSSPALVASRHFINGAATPPNLGGELSPANSFTASPSAPFRNGTIFSWRGHPSFARRGILCSYIRSLELGNRPASPGLHSVAAPRLNTGSLAAEGRIVDFVRNRCCNGSHHANTVSENPCRSATPLVRSCGSVSLFAVGHQYGPDSKREGSVSGLHRRGRRPGCEHCGGDRRKPVQPENLRQRSCHQRRGGSPDRDHRKQIAGRFCVRRGDRSSQQGDLYRQQRYRRGHAGFQV